MSLLSLCVQGIEGNIFKGCFVYLYIYCLFGIAEYFLTLIYLSVNLEVFVCSQNCMNEIASAGQTNALH